MKTIHTIAAVVLLVLLGATGYGILHTEPPAVTLPTTALNGSQAHETGDDAAPSQPTVDQSPLKTAQELATLVTLPEERPHAQEALRLADHEVDIAFTAALRDVTQHPPQLSPEAKQIQARLQQSERSLASDKAQIAQLTAAAAKASGDAKDSLEDQIDIANAQEELDQDEVDDAKQDLIRAGGDPQDRIQAMVKEHEASTKATEVALAATPNPPDEHGLVRKVAHWWALHRKQLLLWRAKSETDVTIASLSTQHDVFDKQLQTAKSKAGSNADGGALAPAARLAWNDNDAGAVVQSTKDRSVLQKKVAAFDKRIDDQKELAGIYDKWIGVVAAKQRIILNEV